MIKNINFLKINNSSGFTLMETLVVIAIIMVLFAIAMVNSSSFSSQADVDESALVIMNALRLAQSKTLASEEDSNYGVHCEEAKCILFKGIVYNSLDPDNKIYNFSPQVEIPVAASGIDLEGGGSEVVFDRVTGATAQFGTIKILRYSTFN